MINCSSSEGLTNRPPICPAGARQHAPAHTEQVDRDNDDKAGELPVGPRLVVPNDARALARDVEAWRREQRWDRRKRFVQRCFLGSPSRARAIQAPLVITSLLVVAMLGATLAFPGHSGHRDATTPVPLVLAAPAATAGSIGGLVPDVTLVGSTGTTSARAVRPALLALMRADCRCDRALARLTDAAADHGLTVDLIATPATATEVDALAAKIDRPNVRVLLDPQSVLASAYGRAAFTAVAVHADGVVDDVLTDITDTAAVDATLTALKQPAHAGA